MAYIEKVWQPGDRLTATQLNRIEQGIAEAVYNTQDIVDEESLAKFKIINTEIGPNAYHTDYKFISIEWTAEEIQNYFENPKENIILKTHISVEWPEAAYLYVVDQKKVNNKYIINFSNNNKLSIQIVAEDGEVTGTVTNRSSIPSFNIATDAGKSPFINDHIVWTDINSISSGDYSCIITNNNETFQTDLTTDTIRNIINDISDGKKFKIMASLPFLDEFSKMELNYLSKKEVLQDKYDSSHRQLQTNIYKFGTFMSIQGQGFMYLDLNLEKTFPVNANYGSITWALGDVRFRMYRNPDDIDESFNVTQKYMQN